MGLQPVCSGIFAFACARTFGRALWNLFRTRLFFHFRSRSSRPPPAFHPLAMSASCHHQSLARCLPGTRTRLWSLTVPRSSTLAHPRSGLGPYPTYVLHSHLSSARASRSHKILKALRSSASPARVGFRASQRVRPIGRAIGARPVESVTARPCDRVRDIVIPPFSVCCTCLVTPPVFLPPFRCLFRHDVA